MATYVITKEGEKGKVVGNDGKRAAVFIESGNERSTTWFPWDELRIVGIREESESFEDTWKERLLKEYYT